MTKREIGFALSLITIITSPLFLGLALGGPIARFMHKLIWVGADFEFPWVWIPIVTSSLISLVLLTMVIGLSFMKKSKTSKRGGVIVLIMGMIMMVMLVFLMMAGEKIGTFLLIPAVMAIVGGCLGIQGAREDKVEKRQYPKKFISGVSITGFIFALLSVFVFFLFIGAELAGLFFIYFVSPSLWIISVILNAISTVIIKRKESILQKRTKILMIMLIIATWCIIASAPAGVLLLFLLE